MKFLPKLFNKVLTLLALTCICFSLIGCTEKGDAHDFYYFKTQIHVQTQSGKFNDQILDEIDQILANLEDEFALNEPSSFTNRFNDALVGNVNANDDVLKVICACKQAYELTDGAFNPAVLPLNKIWGFSNYPVVNFTPPNQEQIEQITQSGCLDFSLVSVDLEQKTVYKPHKDMQIDLGGIAKGYACDLISKLLLDNGYTDGYVNLGGSSLQIIKMNEFGISHPRKDGSILTVNCESDRNLSISTSGDYHRFYVYLGQRYCHIIDGKLGAPKKTNVVSATITGVDGMTADALSTALCLCNYSTNEDTLTPLINKIVNAYPNAKVYAVIIDGEQKTILTNALENTFALNDGEYSIVKI